MPDDAENLIRRLIGGDQEAPAELDVEARTSTSPTVLVAAALLAREPHDLLARAARAAATTRDRQLVTIAATHLSGNAELLDALVRDHLADHPGNILAAWIAAQHAGTDTPTTTSTPIRSAS